MGNVVTAFAVTAIGINLAGAPNEIVAAFYVAIMTGMLALGKELQDESAGKIDYRSSPLLLL